MTTASQKIQGAAPDKSNAAQNWQTIRWAVHERRLKRMQEQIFQHAKDRKIRKLHIAQKRLLRSWSGRLMAVRITAEYSNGKKTAGIDGVASPTPGMKFHMAEELSTKRRPRPVRRIEIPKPGETETRPLGIPTLYDRAVQTLVLQALQPQLEAAATKTDQNSYGFMTGRGVNDAASAVRKIIDKRPKYVLRADIEKCFDRISHEAILDSIETWPPLRRYLRQVLRAGAISEGKFIPTKEGTPQGGPLSGMLLNFALLGLEQAITATGQPTKMVNGKPVPWRIFVVRYADDILILHHDRATLDAARAALTTFLEQRGLRLNEAKTTIRHTLDDLGDGAGFDFLGLHIRQHHKDPRLKKSRRPYVTLITPAQKGLQRHYRHLTEIIDHHRASQQDDLIERLNLIICGFAYSKRTENSKKALSRLDHQVHRKLRAWAKRRHGDKGKRWIVTKYFNAGKPWIFTSGKPGAPVLMKHADVEIVPHVKVQMGASPFDGNRKYWERRQHRVLPQGRDNGAPQLIHPLHRKYRHEARATREVAEMLRPYKRGRMVLPHTVQISGELYDEKLSCTVLKTGAGRETCL